MIKVIAGSLFFVENNTIILDRMNTELEKFINYPFVNAGLKYDIQNKLGKAVIKEIESINEFRIKLVGELGKEKNDNSDEVNRQLIELLNSEIELECGRVSLSKLLDENCSGFNFNILDKFIVDDRT
jgi:hypothetical protein